MNDFLITIRLGINLVLKPGENRLAALNHAGEMGKKMFSAFLFPMVIFAALFSAYPYYVIDGGRIGVLVWLCYILLYSISSGILAETVWLISKGTKPFLYSLAYLIFWICLGDILYSISTMVLGIIGKFFLYLFFKLGAVWVANLTMNEMIFAEFDLDVPQLKSLSTRMTLALVVIGLGVPYVIQMGIDWIVKNLVL